MAKSISLKIDVQGQDELFKAQKSVNQLTKEKKLLNDQFKKGKVGEKAYAKGLAKVNVNLKASKTRVNQLNKELLVKNGLMKKGGSFTNKMAGAMGKMVIGIGVAVAGFKALTGAISGAMEKNDEQTRAEKSLQVALGGTSEALLQQARALQQVTRFGDEAIIQGQGYLAQMGLTEKEIGRLTPALLDMASAQGMSVDDAFKIASKTMGSTTNALSRYGIEVVGAVGTQERMDSIMGSLTDKFDGQAEAMADIGAGPMQQMSNAWGDLMEQGGGIIYDFINPFIKKITKWIPKIPAMFKKVSNKVKELYNWFVELYNQSLAFRYIIVSIQTTFKNFKTIISGVVNYIIGSFKNVGNVLKGVFTLDWKLIKKGYVDQAKHMKDTFSKTGQEMKDNITDAFDKIKNGQAKTLEISDSTEAEVVADYGTLGEKAGKEFVKKTAQEIEKARKDAFKKEIQELTDEQKTKIRLRKKMLMMEYALFQSIEFTTIEERNAYLKKLEEDYQLDISNIKTSSFEGQLSSQMKFGEQTLDTQMKILDEQLKNLKKNNTQKKDAQEVADADQFAVATATAQALSEIGNRRTARELEQLDEKKEKGILTDEEYDKAKENIERKAFNRKKAMDMAQVVINFAQANAKTFSTLGFPAGLMAIPVLTGLMMGQLALIGSQKYAQGGLVDGGIFKGASHSQGGIKFASGGRLMEAEGGEAIINKRSTSMFKPLLSRINSSGGGVKFADGGILNSMGGNFDMFGVPTASTNVVVVESDITNSQNQVSTIESNASF